MRTFLHMATKNLHAAAHINTRLSPCHRPCHSLFPSTCQPSPTTIFLCNSHAQATSFTTQQPTPTHTPQQHLQPTTTHSPCLTTTTPSSLPTIPRLTPITAPPPQFRRRRARPWSSMPPTRTRPLRRPPLARLPSAPSLTTQPLLPTTRPGSASAPRSMTRTLRRRPRRVAPATAWESMPRPIRQLTSIRSASA